MVSLIDNVETATSKVVEQRKRDYNSRFVFLENTPSWFSSYVYQLKLILWTLHKQAMFVAKSLILSVTSFAQFIYPSRHWDGFPWDWLCTCGDELLCAMYRDVY